LKLPDKNLPLQSWFHAARSWLERKEKDLDNLDGLSPGWQIAVFGLVLMALFSRRPSLITHAQFYAEDGTIWFAQAYNGGWLHSLVLQQAGYLNTMPRLGAGLALLFPFQWAPLVMAIIGIFIQAVPVPILLSPRCRNWASLSTRLGLAAVYLALPNPEIHVVLTNSQWHLAVAAALVAFADSPRTWVGRAFDAVILLVSALSGPFGIILAPMALLFWWLRRQPWSLAAFALITLGSCPQLVLLLHGGPRIRGPLGAAPATFLRILGGDVVAGAILGGSSFAWRAPMMLIVASAVVGLAVYFYCLCLANPEWKLFLVYCAAVFAASLRSPLTGETKPAWDMLIFAVSARYWFLPMLAFAWSAVWCTRYGGARFFKLAGAGILISMSFGVVRDWKYGAFTDENFAAATQRMREAKPGDHVIIPIVPEGWYVELVKKSF
jgi:hypothetical protein